LIILIAKLLTGFVAAFLAILSWSKTREGSWMFIVSGTLTLYINQLYEILVELGVLSFNIGMIADFPVLSTTLKIIPYLFYIAGFTVFLWKKRKF